jgi:hypothetical protein
MKMLYVHALILLLSPLEIMRGIRDLPVAEIHSRKEVHSFFKRSLPFEYRRVRVFSDLPSISPPSSAFQRLAGLIAFTIGSWRRLNHDPTFYFVAALRRFASTR